MKLIVLINSYFIITVFDNHFDFQVMLVIVAL